jgi:hypothetical protein
MTRISEATMRTRRSTFGVVAAALLVGVALATRADVPAAAFSRTVTIPIVGTVEGLPESVALSGKIEIVSTVVSDQVDGSPKTRLSVRLVGVSGAGVVTGAKYVAAGEQSLVRRLSTSDRLDITFPFFRATVDGPLSARSAVASITLNYDLLTGAVTKATAAFSTPKMLAQ